MAALSATSSRACRAAPARALALSRPAAPFRQRIATPGRSTRLVVRAEIGMAPELKAAIDDLITKNKVVVFMKGTKQFPQCGFSNTVVQILREMDVPFESVNVLEADAIRSGMKEYSAWPTFPQVYIDGEFFGGCDIMIETYQSGELKETLERVMNS